MSLAGTPPAPKGLTTFTASKDAMVRGEAVMLRDCVGLGRPNTTVKGRVAPGTIARLVRISLRGLAADQLTTAAPEVTETTCEGNTHTGRWLSVNPPKRPIPE
jgi:hypothetical protein